jgi:flagellar biogenesis protein FliO
MKNTTPEAEGQCMENVSLMKSRSFLRDLADAAAAFLKGLGLRVAVARKERLLRLCETLSLGDRRFVALVTVEGQKFLLGGAGSSIALLAKLPDSGGLPQEQSQ